MSLDLVYTKRFVSPNTTSLKKMGNWQLEYAKERILVLLTVFTWDLAIVN